MYSSTYTRWNMWMCLSHKKNWRQLRVNECKCLVVNNKGYTCSRVTVVTLWMIILCLNEKTFMLENTSSIIFYKEGSWSSLLLNSYENIEKCAITEIMTSVRLAERKIDLYFGFFRWNLSDKWLLSAFLWKNQPSYFEFYFWELTKTSFVHL